MELMHDENRLPMMEPTSSRDARKSSSLVNLTTTKSSKKMSSTNNTKSATNRKAFTSIDVNSLARSTSELSLKNHQDSKPLSTSSTGLTQPSKSNNECARRSYSCVEDDSGDHQVVTEEKNQYGLQSEDVTSIFRLQRDCKGKAVEQSDDEHRVRTLRKASAIHDETLNDKVRHVQNRPPSGTIQLMDSHRVADMNISALYESRYLKAEESSEPTQSVFREAPNENFFTEEMEMMMTLKLANPIDEESDFDYDVNNSYEDLSINDENE